MGVKTLLFLFALFIAFQVSLDSADALCTIGCKFNGPMEDLRCYYQTPNDLGGNPGLYGTCMINPQGDGTTTAWSAGASCNHEAMGNFCNSNACPSDATQGVGSQNGAPCKVLLPCDNGGSCSADEGNGKWDASESKCVACSGKSENNICGDGSGIYMGPSEGSYAGPKTCLVQALIAAQREEISSLILLAVLIVFVTRKLWEKAAGRTKNVLQTGNA